MIIIRDQKEGYETGVVWETAVLVKAIFPEDVGMGSRVGTLLRRTRPPWVCVTRFKTGVPYIRTRKVTYTIIRCHFPM